MNWRLGSLDFCEGEFGLVGLLMLFWNELLLDFSERGLKGE